MNWQDRIRNPDCELCPLHEGAQHVCLMGSGSRKSEVMIVGEAPGAREDESHQAFVGPAGKLLTELLEEVGLSRDNCYITNAAKCRPPDNRTPERGEAKICAETYLSREIAVVEPRLIFLLGNTALQAVARKSGITKHRGKIFTLPGGLQAFATFHPAAVLRNPRYGAEVRADFARFARLVRGEPSDATPTKVKIIRNATQLKWLLRQLKRAEVIAYDIETWTEGGSGLEDWHGDRSKIVTIGFSWQEGHAAVVPVEHASSPWGKLGNTVLQLLKTSLERDDCKYIAHNGKFDNRWLAQKGIFVPQTFDTMLAAHMLDENRSKGLKPLSQVLLGADAYDIGEDVKDAYNAPLKRLCIYNGKDCDYTLRLYHIFREELKEEPRVARVFMKLMMPASNTLTKVERVGLWVDKDRLRERTSVAVRNVGKLRKVMHQHMPDDWTDFNFNSTQQLGRWLFGHLGLPILQETPKGAASTAESVLLQLQDHEPVKALLKYRKWSKYLNTYLVPWEFKRDAHGRLHTTYKPAGTVTGRLSSSDPNLQQVPREPLIRGILGAPPGWLLVEADYSQVELRVAAMLANETSMLRSFHLGEDIHMKRACRMTGKTADNVTSEERKKAKAVNFGYLYGMGAAKFVMYARDNYGVEVSLEEAEADRAQFFADYPRLRSWHDRQRRLANRYQRVQSPIGRVRHLPDMQSGDKDVRAEAERQAINSPVQSFASDLMLVSLVRLDRVLPSRVARLVGTVHDAILFEVHTQALAETVRTIRETMEDLEYVRKVFGTQVTVPIEVEVKVGQHWGEGEVYTDE